MKEKESIKCRLKIPSPWENCSALLGKTHDAEQLPCDRIFNPDSSTIKDLYIQHVNLHLQ